MTKQSEKIAKIIIDTINKTDSNVLGAWGSKDFKPLSSTKDNIGGVSFIVNGIKFQGLVEIYYSKSNSYMILFKNEGEISYQVENVAIDHLVETIDWIEKIKK